MTKPKKIIPDWSAEVSRLRAEGAVSRAQLIDALLTAHPWLRKGTAAAMARAHASELVEEHQSALTVDEMHDLRRVLLAVTSAALKSGADSVAALKVLAASGSEFSEARVEIACHRAIADIERGRVSMVRDAVVAIVPKAVRLKWVELSDDEIADGFPVAPH